MAITPLEELACLRLTDLNRQGYLTDRRGGLVYLNQGQQLVAQVRLTVWLAEDEDDEPDDPNQGSIELRYEWHGQPRYQLIELVRRPSNLGISGGIWYFVCPRREQRCQVLYLDTEGFCSRQGLEQARYASQRLIRSERAFARRLRQIHQIDAFQQLQRDWFWRPGSKHHYRGKLTRPMQRFLKLKATCALHVSSYQEALPETQAARDR